MGVRSVTLDGDVYDPSGTLSGGSAPSGSGILVRVQELMGLGEKLSAAGRKLEALEREETQGKRARDNWRQFVRELEMKEHEMKLMEQQVESSNAARVSPYPLPLISGCLYLYQIGTQVEELKQTIADLRLAVQAAKDKQKAGHDECKKLERDMAEFKDNKEGKIDELKVNARLYRDPGDSN